MSSRISALRFDSITQVFGAVRALAAVSFEIRAGEIVAVMGKNGAGKSTLLAIASLRLRPTRGSVIFDGERANPRDARLRGRIGVLAHEPLLYADLTPRQNLRLFAGLHGLADAATRVSDALEALGLGSPDERPCRCLSRGRIQTVALARAILADPDILLLDEPAAGLDAATVERLVGTVMKHRERGGMAMIATHDPDLATSVATRAVILEDGVVAFDGPAPGDLAGWRALARPSGGQGGRR